MKAPFRRSATNQSGRDDRNGFGSMTSSGLLLGQEVPLGTWTVDPSHSHLEFTARHLVVAKVKGMFTGFAGVIQVGEANGGKSLEVRTRVEIDAASIDTREPDRDAHLRSADFLDVERHPQIVFIGQSVESDDRGAFEMSGSLSVRGTTRPVLLAGQYAGQLTDPYGNHRIAFEAKTQLRRSEWGLTWNQVLESGGLLVGDHVDVELAIEATKA